MLDLYRLAEPCSYGVLREEMIRDRIVVGLRNAALSEKLQMDPDLTLKKATDAARQSESIKKQQGLLRSDFQESRKSDKTAEYLEGEKPPNSYRCRPNRVNTAQCDPPKPQSKLPSKCTRCGWSPLHGRQLKTRSV